MDIVKSTESLLLTSSPYGITAITDEKGNPWFVAKEVCVVLDIVNVTRALSSLDYDEKSTLHTVKGGPARNIINESGLYSLILRSRKTEAKAFKKWVTSEVLPQIRKYCKYRKILKPVESTGLEFGPRGITIIPESDLYRLIIKSRLPKAEEFERWIMDNIKSHNIKETVTMQNTNTEIQKFNFNGNDVTTIQDEKGEPWFVAKEVCEILNLDNRETARKLDADEVGKTHMVDSIGRNPTLLEVMSVVISVSYGSSLSSFDRSGTKGLNLYLSMHKRRSFNLGHLRKSEGVF